MHPISLATSGKFAGPARAKFVTGQPPRYETESHIFPKVEVTDIETEGVIISIKSIESNGYNYDY